MAGIDVLFLRWLRLFSLTLVIICGWLIVAGSEWVPTTWNGEEVLSARSGSWTAIVSIQRGRLVSISHPAGGELMRIPPHDLRQARSLRKPGGSHMAWLGPIDEWGWPPPRVWEYDTPLLVRPSLDVVEFVTASDDGFPQLHRRYVWTDQGLETTISWTGSGHSGIHVVQIEPTVGVYVNPVPTRVFPSGWAQGGLFADRYKIREAIPGISPEEATVVDGHLRPGKMSGKPLKLFVCAQSIACVYPTGARLEMVRGRVVDDDDGDSDANMLTQFYIAGDHSYMEIEQSSRVAVHEKCSFSIFLKPSIGD